MKDDRRKISRDIILVVVFVVFACFFFYMLTSLGMSGIKFDKPIDYSKGWQMQADKENYTVEFSRAVTKNMEGRTINFYAYDAYITATLDGRQIYHYGEPVAFCKSPASFQQFINIPVGSSGQRLSIKIETVYPNKYTTEYEMLLGSISGIAVYRLKGEMCDIVANAVLLILGLALIVLFFSQLSRHIVDKGALYLGLISILFVAGSSCDMFLFQLILPNGVAQYFLYYFVLYILPLLMMSYLETISDKLKCSHVFCSHLLLILVLYTLQLTGVAEMTETLVVYFILSGIELIIVGIMLAKKGIDKNNRLHYAFLVLIGSIILNAIHFLFNSVKGVSMLIAKLGLCFYLAVAIHNYILGLVRRLAEARNADILRHQAYTDHLTELGNRLAFAEKMKEIDVSQLALVSFDINNLKYYNDFMGHACGDNLILKASKLMAEVFDDVYRVGGDEFVAVLTNKTDLELGHLRQKLCALAVKESSEELEIEIACGFAAAKEHDQSYEDVLKRADAAMYRHKLALKRKSAVKSVR